jgi:hypothetical protein
LNPPGPTTALSSPVYKAGPIPSLALPEQDLNLRIRDYQSRAVTSLGYRAVAGAGIEPAVAWLMRPASYRYKHPARVLLRWGGRARTCVIRAQNAGGTPSAHSPLTFLRSRERDRTFVHRFQRPAARPTEHSGKYVGPDGFEPPTYRISPDHSDQPELESLVLLRVPRGSRTRPCALARRGASATPVARARRMGA